MSWGVSPWVYPVWGSLGFLDLGGNLPHFREVFNYYLLMYFLMAFLFVFFFWDSYDSNVGVFNIVPEVSEGVLISFNSFFLFSSLFHIFIPFYLLPHFSYLLLLLFYCWFPPECCLSHLLHYSLYIHSLYRGRKEIEVNRRRKAGVKRIEIDLGSTLFPKFSPQPRTHRGIHRVG